MDDIHAGYAWVMQTIQGHHTDFMSPPVQDSFPEMSCLAPSHERVLDQKIKVLLDKEAIMNIYER